MGAGFGNRPIARSSLWNSVRSATPVTRSLAMPDNENKHGFQRLEMRAKPEHGVERVAFEGKKGCFEDKDQVRRECPSPRHA